MNSIHYNLRVKILLPWSRFHNLSIGTGKDKYLSNLMNLCINFNDDGKEIMLGAKVVEDISGKPLPRFVSFNHVRPI